MHWVERGLTPNAHPVYRVRAVERYGTHSSAMSGPKQVTVDCARSRARCGPRSCGRPPRASRPSAGSSMSRSASSTRCRSSSRSGGAATCSPTRSTRTPRPGCTRRLCVHQHLAAGQDQRLRGLHPQRAPQGRGPHPAPPALTASELLLIVQPGGVRSRAADSSIWPIKSRARCAILRESSLFGFVDVFTLLGTPVAGVRASRKEL